MRTLFKGLVLVLLFVGTWQALSQVEWRQLFQVDSFSRETENQLGKKLEQLLQKSQPDFDVPEAKEALDSLLHRLADSNGLDPQAFHLHLVKNREVNAFALPGSQMVVYSGLLAEVESPEMLAGVMAHEMAHIELGHVRKKLLKEVGLAMLLSATGGEGSPEALRNVLHQLSSTAFDRNLEEEADEMALQYLKKAGIDPFPTGRFFEMMAKEHPETSAIPEWLNTHPESAERARRFLRAEPGAIRPALSPEKWNACKESLK